MRMKLVATVMALVAVALAAPACAGEEFVQLPTRPGVTQPFWVVTPRDKPVASVILFPGGEGVLGADDHHPPTSNNFLVRTRDKFAAQGFLVAVIDAPSDHGAGLGGFRASGEHAQDVAAVIAYLRQKAPVPVWLVGTSRGTISAANAAARLPAGGADGLVLTSSIVSPSKRATAIIGSVDVAAIAIPTLLVHNKEDACPVCSFSGAAGLMAAFTRAPRRELIAVSGGDANVSDPCGPISRHGYLGIEDEVVGDIARWIKGG
ncbi:MAG: alpha/beta hydrolase [Stellaceae bacterium]